jgi:hypothetical protein
MVPVLGATKTDKLIEQINDLQRLDNIRRLRSLLVACAIDCDGLRYGCCHARPGATVGEDA